MHNKSLIYGVGILSVLGFMVIHQREEDSKKEIRQVQAIASQQIDKTLSSIAVLEIQKTKQLPNVAKEKTIESIAQQQMAHLTAPAKEDTFVKEISGELEQVETLWQETLADAYQEIKVSREESAVIANMRQSFLEEARSLDEQYQKATSRARKDLLQMMSRDLAKKYDQHVQEFLGEERFARLESTREQFNNDLDEDTDLRPRVMNYW